MYLLVIEYEENLEIKAEYYGPFPSEARACQYGVSFDDKLVRWHVKPITVPHTVVQRVIWKVER